MYSYKDNVCGRQHPRMLKLRITQHPRIYHHLHCQNLEVQRPALFFIQNLYSSVPPSRRSCQQSLRELDFENPKKVRLQITRISRASMKRKGMRSLCFHSKTSSFAFPSSRASLSVSNRSVSAAELAMERAIGMAEPMIMKWDLDSSTYAWVTSLFHDEKQESHRFVECLKDLQQAMHGLVSEDPASEKLVHGQRLMQVAMKRLQKELYEILSLNWADLDPESISAGSPRTSTTTTRSSISDDCDACAATDSISEVEDLRSIVDCMISLGYAKECMGIYKITRKSIIDERIYRLGVENLTPSQVQKMHWEAIEAKLKSWSDAMKGSVRTLLYWERILCDHIFAASDAIRESCFGEITREGAALLFGSFPQTVARRCKKSPEKVFRLLDMYAAISDNWPEIEAVFELSSTSSVRSLVQSSLIRLGESVRASLADFESMILKDSSKLAVPGGGVHPLTVNVMNHLCLLSDYSSILSDISVDEQTKSPVRLPLPESYFDSPDRDDISVPAISARLAWQVLILLCKLGSKAKYYKDVSLSYLFLANNVQHVVSKVRSSNLRYLLGEEWIMKHEDKVSKFAANYERIGWGNVAGSLVESTKPASTSPEEKFMRFNSNFEDTCRRQSSSLVPDRALRERIKASIEQNIVPAYRELYDTHKAVAERKRTILCSTVKYAPEDIARCLFELFAVSGDRTSPSLVQSSLSSRRCRLQSCRALRLDFY